MFSSSSSMDLLGGSHHHHNHSPGLLDPSSSCNSLSGASSSSPRGDLPHSFSNCDYTAKWHGLFLPGLRRVMAVGTVGNGMRAKEEALDYVDKLLLQLLGILTARPHPHSLQDLQDRVAKLFPHPIDEWALEEANKAVTRGNSSGGISGGGGGGRKKSSSAETAAASSLLVFGIEKLGPVLKEILGHKVDPTVTIFLGAILEYIAADVLHLVSNYVKNSRRGECSTQDVKAAVSTDKVLCDLFKLGDHAFSSSVLGSGSLIEEEGDEDEDEFPSQVSYPSSATTTANSSTATSSSKKTQITYNEVVEDLLQSERQYLRDLQMLIKVFREQLADKLENYSYKDDATLEQVFSCIEDMTEVTVSLISSIEDTMEMMTTETAPAEPPAVGICFLELAENWEFDVYDRYAQVYNESTRQSLESLLSRPEIERRVGTAGRGYPDALKFYFPRLLMEPFSHCIQYFEFIKTLTTLSPSDRDKTEFLQADSALTPLKTRIHQLNPNVNVISKKGNNKTGKNFATLKLAELKGSVEGFSSSFGTSHFNEFYCEGEVNKVGGSGKGRGSERVFWLFDGCLFFAKKVGKRGGGGVVGGVGAVLLPGGGGGSSSGGGGIGGGGNGSCEYRLKEVFYLARVEVRDREDNDEWKNLFDVIPRGDQSMTPVVFSAKTVEEKRAWMGVLVMLTTKSMLDRFLDRLLTDEEKKHPLRLPSPDKYRFAVPDSSENILFDKDQQSGHHFIIKGATLLKLIERLTHHQYFDHAFVNTFLTTYRSFCSPNDFLNLLIERFNIPEPDPEGDVDPESLAGREMLKRFRKEYARLVQLRVLNVIKQWIIHHFYDFERDSQLLSRLASFLESAEDYSSSRGQSSIFQSVRRCLLKAEKESGLLTNNGDNNLTDDDHHQKRAVLLSAVRSPPPIEYHIRCPQEEWSILTLHPIELARQLTLLEFDLYRVVKPSELVGSVWTKKNKDQLSPNLLKMIKHTTKVTRWLERTILDTENLEERIAVVSRILEVMVVMDELNNFNGVLAVVSAMGSASVHRLQCTFQGVKSTSTRLIRALEEAQELGNDHYRKYQERLRSINPPCVPFFGMYLTNILHIEEGNLDFLPNSPDLINFSKRRKVAEITAEIRQFQYSHYTLAVEPRIREWIENLSPFPATMSETEISNYLYEKSLEIEPRNSGGNTGGGGSSGGGSKKEGLPKFPRRWPDVPLKSPGIKRNGRGGPGPLLLPFSTNSISLQSLASVGRSKEHNSISSFFTPDSSSLGGTADLLLEKTPKTPNSLGPSVTSSPQDEDHHLHHHHRYGHGDFSIFAPVLIGPIPTPPVSNNNNNNSNVNAAPPPPPPPRPPKGSSSSSRSTGSSVPPPESPSSATDALSYNYYSSSPAAAAAPLPPPPPPHPSNNSFHLEMPPPLPPRRGTPRTPSSAGGGGEPPLLPRRGSSSTTASSTGGCPELSPHHVNLAGPHPPPASPPKRLNNNHIDKGGSLPQNTRPVISGTQEQQDLRFVFTSPASSTTTAGEIFPPPSNPTPPALPPKTNKTLLNSSPFSN